MNDPTIIIGPPGTGKTTAIVARIEDYLATGGRADRVGYVSFTRRALHVARDRMFQRFQIPKSDLPYFRTLHSMCYHLAGVSPEQVADDQVVRSIGHRLGLPVEGTGVGDEGHVSARGASSPLLFHENLARLTGRSMAVHQADRAPDIDVDELELFHRTYTKLKMGRGLVDFTDILGLGLKATTPQLDLLLVDEAQDLSHLQWLVVRHLARTAQTVVVAGDANQAIYSWAGADVGQFIGLRGHQTVLGQGYRMARAPHRVAAQIAQRITAKHKASFRPREAPGTVTHLAGLSEMAFPPGEYLVMARTNHLLNQARRDWGDWQPHIKPRFATIHGAKGDGCENVVLMTGMTRQCQRQLQDRPDEELRVWYVGVSRTSDNLYVVRGPAPYQFQIED